MDMKTTPPMDVLLVTADTKSSQQGGRGSLSSLYQRALEEVLGEKLIVFKLTEESEWIVYKLIHMIKGRLDGLSRERLDEIISIVASRNINTVFIDGSNLGLLAGVLKRRFPYIRIVTMYHNVEAKFFYDSFLRRKDLKSLLVLFALYRAEKKATRFSDVRLCLTSRDAELLSTLYKAGCSYVYPLCVDCLRDRAGVETAQDKLIPDNDYALFVGSNFYGNYEGIKWYRDNVAPFVPFNLYVVGRGFENDRARLECENGIVIVGSVDSLGQWYENAKFVIAPILSGSGMKTKVAEAMMFGKRVVGTPEAFVGYERFLPRLGWVADSPNGFVEACILAGKESTDGAGQELISIYKRYYSYEAAVKRLRRMFLQDCFEVSGEWCDP